MGTGRAARALAATLAIASLTAVAAGCAGDDSADANDGKLKVATTVAPITSIVANIGGDRVDVTGIVPEGTNSHTFEPKPSVAELLSEADVVFVNGLQLEEPTKDLAEQNLKDGAADRGARHAGRSPRASTSTTSRSPRTGGKPNPHLWTNPPLAKLLRRDRRRATLAKRDPANAAYYRGNYARSTAPRSTSSTRRCARRSPRSRPASRKLLTYHDAYAYFAERLRLDRHRRHPGRRLRGPDAQGGRRA